METAIYIPPIEIPTEAMDAMSEGDAILKLYHLPYKRYRTDPRGAGSLELTRTLIRATEGLPLIYTNTCKVITYESAADREEITYEPDEEYTAWLHGDETTLTNEKQTTTKTYSFNLLNHHDEKQVTSIHYIRGLGSRKLEQEQKEHNSQQNQKRRKKVT